MTVSEVCALSDLVDRRFAWYSPGSAMITACQDEGGQP
jgi:hypothetical protein